MADGWAAWSGLHVGQQRDFPRCHYPTKQQRQTYQHEQQDQQRERQQLEPSHYGQHSRLQQQHLHREPKQHHGDISLRQYLPKQLDKMEQNHQQHIQRYQSNNQQQRSHQRKHNVHEPMSQFDKNIESLLQLHDDQPFPQVNVQQKVNVQQLVQSGNSHNCNELQQLAATQQQIQQAINAQYQQEDFQQEMRRYHRDVALLQLQEQGMQQQGQLQYPQHQHCNAKQEEKLGAYIHKGVAAQNGPRQTRNLQQRFQQLPQTFTEQARHVQVNTNVQQSSTQVKQFDKLLKDDCAQVIAHYSTLNPAAKEFIPGVPHQME